MKCKICGIRKPRRYCPGVQGDICSICCGNEREVTVDCPFECPYLREARAHEKPHEVDFSKLPNADVNVSDRFLNEHKELITFLGFALAEAIGQTRGAVDHDVSDALQALTRTYRTMTAGLYYDTRPTNPSANSIYSAIQKALSGFHEHRKKQGFSTLRDSEILGALVTFERLAATYDNGRPKGRSFIDYVQEQFKIAPEERQPASPLIEL